MKPLEEMLDEDKAEKNEGPICPLSNANPVGVIHCLPSCPWWMSDTVTDCYECAITRIARLMP